MKQFDVVSICNALYDVIYSAEDSDLVNFGFTKGNMHLVDRDTQERLLKTYAGYEKAEELGGSAMNAMRALAMLNKKVSFGGAISEDHHGKKIRSRMQELKMSPHLNVTTQEATGTCLVLVTPDGERTMVTYLGASRLYDNEVLPDSVLSSARYFHFCGYQWDTNEQKSAIIKAIDTAKAAGTKISLDLADPFVVTHHKKDLTDLVEQKADLVFANKEESKLLYGESPEKTAEIIANSGALAVIKLGAEGALIASKDQQIRVQPVKTQVVDTTAAGDMFAAGFLYGLCDERPLDECGRIAARLASDVISRYGAVLSDDVIKAILAA